ncbi:MAG: alpha/beta fold hydrolase [Candidatus Eremiobacteraeota bacterium]|nr:alpha/beta fold hydrolase [Candidatus Eremiobacteraeota bacterium]
MESVKILQSDPSAAAEAFLRPLRQPPAARHVLPITPGRDAAFLDGSVSATHYGVGRVVILVHGWEGNRSDLLAFVDPLVERGYSALAIDLPAHGASQGDMTSIPELGLALAAIGTEIGTLAGAIAHSVGTAATALAISRGLQTRRLVLIAPPANYGAYVRAFMAANVEASAHAESIAEVRRRIGIDADDVDTPTFLANSSVPGLILHSTDDRVVNIADARAIADAWPAARLVEFAGLGHRRILSDSGAIAQAADFIASQENDE